MKENLCLCGCFQLVSRMFVRGHYRPGMISVVTRLKISQSMVGHDVSKKTRVKISKANSKPVGSKRRHSNGYIIVKTVDGWRREHRVVMEKKLGRKLASNEIPHHRNEKKDDNRPMNLRCMIRRKHQRMHALGNKNAVKTIPSESLVLS